MRSFYSKETLMGILIGLVSPLIFLPLVWFILGQAQHVSVQYMWLQFDMNDMIKSKHLSLALISNLIWFYYFLNREKYMVTRGLILGMLVYAPYMLYIFFTNYEFQ
jgi:hypothetical protein